MSIPINNLRDSSLSDSIRAFISIEHFADHFKEFKEGDDEFRFERESANNELNRSIIGTWLFRRSSYNRSFDKNDLIKKGLYFYVLSYKNINKNIYHILIIHQLGKGWNTAYNIKNENEKFIFDNLKKWYVCFIDLLEKLIEKYKFNFDLHRSNYLELINSED